MYYYSPWRISSPSFFYHFISLSCVILFSELVANYSSLDIAFGLVLQDGIFSLGASMVTMGFKIAFVSLEDKANLSIATWYFLKATPASDLTSISFLFFD